MRTFISSLKPHCMKLFEQYPLQNPFPFLGIRAFEVDWLSFPETFKMQRLPLGGRRFLSYNYCHAPKINDYELCHH
jgi:hypothetical protein